MPRRHGVGRQQADAASALSTPPSTARGTKPPRRTFARRGRGGSTAADSPQDTPRRTQAPASRPQGRGEWTGPDSPGGPAVGRFAGAGPVLPTVDPDSPEARLPPPAPRAGPGQSTPARIATRAERPRPTAPRSRRRPAGREGAHAGAAARGPARRGLRPEGTRPEARARCTGTAGPGRLPGPGHSRLGSRAASAPPRASQRRRGAGRPRDA